MYTHLQVYIAVICLALSLDISSGVCEHALRPPKPYMMSLKSRYVYVRRGPGKEYPVAWIITCPQIPLKVSQHFGFWYYIEGPRGIKGWLHKAMLSPLRTVFIVIPCFLYAKKKLASRRLAYIRAPNIGVLLEDGQDWLYVTIAGRKGFAQKKNFWTS